MMGFNKRYITKDSLINHIKSGKRATDLLRADALIMDEWSSYFFDNYNTSNYKDLRKTLNEDTMFSSTHSTTIEHKNFQILMRPSNLSNILEDLIIDPSWTEILLTTNILGDDNYNPENAGKYTKLKEYCTDKIISHYTTESREKKINNVLK